MNIFLSIIIMLLVFSVLALVHEWGHFIAARIFKVKVVEFSVFMGPKLFQHVSKRSGTKYTLRLLPLGGYCAFEDDLPKKEDSNTSESSAEAECKDEENKEPDTSLNGQVWWKRAIIFSAGVFMNIVLALIVSVVMIASTGFSSSIIENTNEGSLACKIGIEAGDKLVKCNGLSVTNYADYQVAVLGIKDKNDDANIMDSHYSLTYKKASGAKAVYDIKKHLVTKENDDGKYIASWSYTISKTEDGKVTDYYYEGIYDKINEDKTAYVCDVTFKIDDEIISNESQEILPENFATLGNDNCKIINSKNPFKVIAYGFTDMISWVKSVYVSLYWLINGTLGMEALSGPIGLTSVVNDVVSVSEVAFIYKFATLFYLAGLISANLAVMNFLPFPGLDGFYIVLVIFELITGGKKMSVKVQNIISYIGLGLLLLLAGIVAVMDILKLV